MHVVEEVILVALDAGGKIMVHARGNAAGVVAIATAAALVSVSTGVGYGLYAAARECRRYLRESEDA
jgi:ribulose 1,5-bisphosphate carboxylase large subunit-like protein